MATTDQNNLEVLIVDDDAVVNMLHKEQIKRSPIPYNIRTFINGKEALQHLESKKSNSSFLVLLDLNMPVMNGWEFIEEVERADISAEVFIVVVTSSIYEEDKDRVLRSEKVIGFCTKPLFLKDIEGIKKKEEVQKFFN